MDETITRLQDQIRDVEVQGLLRTPRGWVEPLPGPCPCGGKRYVGWTWCRCDGARHGGHRSWQCGECGVMEARGCVASQLTSECG